MSEYGPQRIVCLTEETTEWLYLLGQEHKIVGISGYTVRPPRARAEKPKVSAFTSARIDRIMALEPDCVFGFSDLQADIAASLIRRGVQVTIFNQRSIAQILSMMMQVAAIVGQAQQGEALIDGITTSMRAVAAAAESMDRAGMRRPVVYFEEWDDPHISAIAWVSELIAVAGGIDCFAELGKMPMGRDRIIADGAEIIGRNPDIIIGSWCGKKFRADVVAARPGWRDVAAVRDKELFEIKSPDILQPGPAALTDGLHHLHRIIAAWRGRLSAVVSERSSQ
ncbi:MAG: ABC transporter substrate-binding protein [Herminiimonas sp.]|nr:ABC transporter substrate-binding protein [Herminiimonas sp.]